MGEASPCCRSLCRDSSATVLKYSWWGGFSTEGSKWSFTRSQRSPGGLRCHLPSWQADREGDREGRVSRAKWQTRQCDPIHQREGFITVLNALCSQRPETEKTGSEPRLTSARDPPSWSNSGHDTSQRPEFSYSRLRGGSRQTERQCNTEDDVWHQAECCWTDTQRSSGHSRNIYCHTLKNSASSATLQPGGYFLTFVFKPDYWDLETWQSCRFSCRVRNMSN